MARGGKRNGAGKPRKSEPKAYQMLRVEAGTHAQLMAEKEAAGCKSLDELLRVLLFERQFIGR